MRKEFNYFMPTKIVFGNGYIDKVEEYIKKYGINKLCLITDSFLAETSFGQKLIESINGVKVFTEVEINPGIQSINACAQKIKEWDCDGIIALGGGSSIDTAKAASVCALSGESIHKYLDGNPDKIEIKNTLPVIAIPTTSGTGSEVSQYAVITDEKSLRKYSITSEHIYPKVAIVDPVLTTGLSVRLTIDTGLDVLSHAMESMFSKIRNSFTEILALEAIRTVFQWLPVCVKEPENIEARGEMAFASTLAGIAMSHCCGTLPHGLGCPLSGHFGVPHGLAVGVLQKYGILSMGHTCDDECQRIISFVNPEENCKREESGEILLQMIDELFNTIGCEKDLKEYHLDEEGIERMVEDAVIHGCTGLHPVEITKEDIRNIYYKLKG